MTLEPHPLRLDAHTAPVWVLSRSTGELLGVGPAVQTEDLSLL